MEMLQTDFDHLRVATSICGPKAVCLALAQMCYGRAMREEKEGRDGYRDRFRQWMLDGSRISAASDRMSGPDVCGLQMPYKTYDDLVGVLSRSGTRTTMSALVQIVAEWDPKTAERLQRVADVVGH